MSQLDKYMKSVDRANKVIESAVAATAELTRQMNNTNDTTFTFSSEGVNFNQLVYEMRRQADMMATMVKEGDIIRVITSNPTAAVKVLGYLGISVDVDGTVNLDKEDKEVAV